MALLSEGGTTYPDILIALTVILIALTSSTLNPIVFRNNYGKKKSIARDLFLTLSTTDYLSSIVIPVNFTVGLLLPKEEGCAIEHNATFCQTRYYEYQRNARLSEKIVSCFVWYLTFSPHIITCALAICRWYQICFPLRHLNRKIVGFILATLCFLFSVYLFVKIFSEPPAQMVIAIQTVISFFAVLTIGRSKFIIIFEDLMLISLASTAILASILTIVNIVKSQGLALDQERRARKIKCTIKIGLLNLGNVIFIAVLMSLSLTKENTIKHTRLQTTSCLFAIVQSAFNPVVYILLTRDALTKVARVDLQK